MFFLSISLSFHSGGFWYWRKEDEWREGGVESIRHHIHFISICWMGTDNHLRQCTAGELRHVWSIECPMYSIFSSISVANFPRVKFSSLIAFTVMVSFPLDYLKWMKIFRLLKLWCLHQNGDYFTSLFFAIMMSLFDRRLSWCLSFLHHSLLVKSKNLKI